MRVSVLAVLPVSGLLATAGCDQTCDRPETAEPTVYHGGEITGETYMTSDWGGDLLHYPGGAHYEIHHGLGAMPVGVAFYLSFERSGVKDGSLAQAAGNEVELRHIDEDVMVVVNGTCAEFYLLATAWTDTGAGGTP